MFGFLKKRGSQDAKAGAPKARKGKDGFYLEADESNAPAVENGAKPAPAEAVKVEAAPAAPAESAADKTAKSKRAKALASAASAQEKKVEAAPQPAPAKPAAPAANGKVQPEAIKTFAPDYLLTLTSTNGRRRPGANMNSFLQMARQVKTR